MTLHTYGIGGGGGSDCDDVDENGCLKSSCVRVRGEMSSLKITPLQDDGLEPIPN